MAEVNTAVRLSDRDTLAEIYKRESRFVSNVLKRLRIPERDLPDVVHEVFIRVQRIFDRYDASRPLRPWLFGIAYRTASDHVRLSRNAREILDVVPAGLSSPGGERVWEALDRWRVADRSLARLAPIHRVVLLMHDFLGYDCREIASALNIVEKTVYSRLHKARARFQTFGLEALRRGLSADGEPDSPVEVD